MDCQLEREGFAYQKHHRKKENIQKLNKCSFPKHVSFIAFIQMKWRHKTFVTQDIIFCFIRNSDWSDSDKLQTLLYSERTWTLFYLLIFDQSKHSQMIWRVKDNRVLSSCRLGCSSVVGNSSILLLRWSRFFPPDEIIDVTPACHKISIPASAR